VGIRSEVDVSGFWRIEHWDFRVHGADLHDITTRELAKDEKKHEVDIGFRDLGS
jgi:hypothetical protein